VTPRLADGAPPAGSDDRPGPVWLRPSTISEEYRVFKKDAEKDHAKQVAALEKQAAKQAAGEQKRAADTEAAFRATPRGKPGQRVKTETASLRLRTDQGQ
jgi:hypothetical protein